MKNISAKKIVERIKKSWDRKHWKTNSKRFEEKIKEAMQFYLYATKLKYKIRSGWDQNHWNVKSERLESIAEHVYGTSILAIALNSEFDLGLNMEKVLKMIAIHEIGEVLIGDITPFDNITPEEKQEMEHKAMRDVLGNLCQSDELFDLLMEFDEHKTKESQFTYLCDKMEADVQAKVYQDKGMQRELSDQATNVVFKNDKAKKMVEDGAQTAFDIWYGWDKDKYEKSPIFQKVLSFAKDNNTNI